VVTDLGRKKYFMRSIYGVTLDLIRRGSEDTKMPLLYGDNFPTKGLYYRQEDSSVSSAVWVAGLRRFCR
jgi:hypothetical protein